ncbi:unnamed protein product [Cuscuta epithymum]|uniref:Uncharacterized protein n=2 Tax=Cuscuta epithymum TaxID=186058 RepID=A0AAV0CPG0_9ASTE|nr:unnamed protein product [Cuscuta epithymum]
MIDTMPEARDRLSRPADVAEVYIRRQVGTSGGGIVQSPNNDGEEATFRWGETGLTGTQRTETAAEPSGGVLTPVRRSPFRTPRTRRDRGSSARGAIIGRQNLSPIAGRRQGRARHRVLPSWYPRRPLQDITAITRAYQRRRERLREGEDEQPETPMLQDQAAHDPFGATPSALLEHTNPTTTPFPALRTGLCPPSTSSVEDNKVLNIVQDWEFLTPQKKLLNSIDTVEKVFKEELQKLKRTPSAKRAEREKKVRTLMSMR